MRMMRETGVQQEAWREGGGGAVVASIVIWWSGLFFLLIGDLGLAAEDKIGRPNVILIVAETLGWGDLGVTGQAKFRTPRLDRFAVEGLRFTNFYAGGTEGVVSRASLLTGKHTGHARIRGNRELALASMDETLGDLAQKAGYHTAALGKWGLGGPGSTGLPTVKGFDDWFGYLRESDATNHYPVTLWRNQTNLFWAKNADGRQEQYAPYLFTQAATNFVSIHRGSPFFLYLAYPLPDAPLQSPTDKPYKDERWPKVQKTLGAMIYRLDREVGRLLDILQRLELERRTVVIFTGATGPHAREGIDPRFFNSTGGHRGHQGDLYDGGLRVPLLVRWPGTIKAGRVSSHLCAAWDLFPTIANLMGLAEFDRGDGISLTPSFLGRRQTRHEFLYWERHEVGGFGQGLRSGDWKLIRSGPDEPSELYHLGRDPTESKDVSGRYRRTLRRLERMLGEARRPSPDWPTPIDRKKD